MGIKVKLEKDICEPCQFGKAYRKRFGTRVSKPLPGYLLSVDVFGPFDTSFCGSKYLIVIKDHYTHFWYGYIEKEKSVPVLSHCISDALAKTHSLGHKVVEFLSDNGGEFDNEQVRSVLSEFGFTQRLSAPYTPQQNGKVQRENRSIVEMTRTLKYSNPDLEFPAQIWAELVTTAIYLLNRLGNSSVERVTPFEL